MPFISSTITRPLVRFPWYSISNSIAPSGGAFCPFTITTDGPSILSVSPVTFVVTQETLLTPPHPCRSQLGCSSPGRVYKKNRGFFGFVFIRGDHADVHLVIFSGLTTITSPVVPLLSPLISSPPISSSVFPPYNSKQYGQLFHTYDKWVSHPPSAMQTRLSFVATSLYLVCRMTRKIWTLASAQRVQLLIRELVLEVRLSCLA
ncbi:hypothetical protein OUZ56_018505 [Daphnia magna]|uniref:Uncharacterized protein n=1 Tax=Daphnia magna TaxID=35525 RepID=A0ABQ9Z956_9CRUS|nr:hypothetical protein OUZ56_018505 [Daphnia magna]